MLEEVEFENHLGRLRVARNKMLTFHKLLIDLEKKQLETGSDPITPAQFLGLLMGDERFEWLRSISKLVVRIDESFELNDGMPPELVVKLNSEVSALFDDSEANPEFKEMVSVRLETWIEAQEIHGEIRALFLEEGAS